LGVQHTTQGQPAGNSARNLLPLLPVFGFALIAQGVTTRSYLRPVVLEYSAWGFVGAWVAWLVALVVLRRPRPKGPRATGAVGRAVTMLITAAGGAGLAVIVVNLALLLVVQHAPSKAVEFRSFVARTGSRKGCSRSFAFPNQPLGRETDMCGDFLRLYSPRAGDWIIVQEQVGALGVTVTAVKKDPK
jgi:hypothetical protein